MGKVSLEQIRAWFKTGLKPTQKQFRQSWDSFWHKDEEIPIENVKNLEESLDKKSDDEKVDGHINSPNAHHELFNKKVDKIENKSLSTEDFTTALKDKLAGIDVPEKTSDLTNDGVSGEPFITQSDIQKSNSITSDSEDTVATSQAVKSVNTKVETNTSLLTHLQTTKVNLSDIVDHLNSTAANQPLSAKQGAVLRQLIENINTLIASDNTSLDEMQEIVDFITQNKEDLNNLGIDNIAGLRNALENINTELESINTILGTKVDKIPGKGLSSEDFTLAEKSILAGIEPGAQVNVQADWNATTGDAFIKNKPNIPAQTTVDSELSEVSLNPVENRIITDALTSTNDKVSLNISQIASLETNKVNLSDIVNTLSSEATNKPLSAKQGAVLKQLIDNINTLIASDDTTLDEVQEIVDFIKQNKSDLDNLGINNIAGLSTVLSDLNAEIVQINNLLDTKVDKIAGKGLSTEDYSTAEKNKLAGISSGAEVNVQADWNATTGDAFIKNKPTIPTQTIVDNELANNSENPVQNKTITSALKTANDKIDLNISQIANLASIKVNLSDIVNTLDSNATDKPLSAKQGNELKLLIDNINTLIASDDSTLDEIQEIVNYIKQNKEDLSNLGIENIAGLSVILSSLEAEIDSISLVLDTKVDKVVGKGLSTEDYSTAEKTKLAGISPGAEANIQADWNATSGDAFIKNKPVIPTQTIVDEELLQDSENPVQNNVVTNALKTTGDKVDANISQIASLQSIKINLSDIINTLDSTATNKPLSAKQGNVLKLLIDNINIFIASDDTNLDSIQKIVDFIKQNRTDLRNLGIDSISGLSAALTDLDNQVSNINDLLGTKVDKITGKGLSTEDYTTGEKNKLAGISSGAEVNVQPDWNATTGDAFIRNKPTIPTQTIVDDRLSEDSENPVQNKIINDALKSTDDKVTLNAAEITNLQATKVDILKIVDSLSSNAADQPLSARQGAVLKQLIDNINTLLASDDTTLDEMQEVVDFIKQNKADLTSLGINNIAGLSTALANLDTKISDNNDLLGTKVDKVTGKGLSTEDYSTDEKGKLAGISPGAEVNVQPDWNATTGDAFIRNKPTIPTQTIVDDRLSEDSENPVQNKIINDALKSTDDKVTLNAAEIANLHATKVDILKIVDSLSSNAADQPLSARQGAVLKQLIDNINTLLASDDATLDEMQEVVNYIKQNKADLASLGIDNIAGLSTALADLNTKISDINDLLGTKVDKITGKGLSTEDYSTGEKNKLAGISPGAEVNVQPDWNATTGDAFIRNKPTIPTQTIVDDRLSEDSENPVQNKIINDALKSTDDKVTLNISEIANLKDTKIDILKIVDSLSSNATDQPLSANQGAVLKQLIDNINTLLASDDTTLDEMQEVVDYIKQNKADLASLGINNIAGLSTALANLDTKISDNNDLLGTKVDKVTGKGLSTEDFTTDEKDKLAGISSGAEVNVQPDWNATTGDAFIRNKPTIPTQTIVDDRLSEDSENPIQNKIINDALKSTDDKVILNTAEIANLQATKVDILKIVDSLSSNAADQPLSARQGAVLKQLIDNINTLLASDDTTLDEMQEVVDYIKQNKADLASLGIDNIAGLSTALANLNTKTRDNNDLLGTKVDKVTGKGLSTEDFTTDEKDKLAGISSGAEVNVQPDWNATTGDAFIRNKPSIPTQTIVDDRLSEDSENPVQNKIINDALKSTDDKVALNASEITNLQNTKIDILKIVDSLTSVATDQPLSARQGAVLKQLIDNINTLLASDDTTLDEMQEVVDFIKQNKADLTSLGIDNIAGLTTALANLNSDIERIDIILNLKVEKEVGKGLSTEDYTTTEKNKLASIASGAEVNIQADWNATTGDAFIRNKPTIPTQTIVDDRLSEDSENPVQNKIVNDALKTADDKIAASDSRISILESTKIELTAIVNNLISDAANRPLSAAQGKVLKQLIDSINSVIASSDPDLNTIQEIVDFIKSNKTKLDSLEIGHINHLTQTINDIEQAIDDIDSILETKVDKVTGKGLSTEDYTTGEKNKLAGISSGAEVNVQADWNATTGDAFIRNKPTIPTQTIVDTELSAASKNPVENRIIHAELKSTNDKVDLNISQIAGLESSKINLSAIENTLISTATNKPLSAKQGAVLKQLIDNINTLLASDDTTLDEMQEIVNYIKQNKADLASLDIDNIAGLSLALSNLDTQINNINDSLGTKVDKVTGKGLSTEDYTSADQAKLAGIDHGAKVNVQADWNATGGDAFIRNKPTIPTQTIVDNELSDASANPVQNKIITDALATTNDKITSNASQITDLRNIKVSKSEIIDALNSGATDQPLSANQGAVLKQLIDNINTILNSDDTTLDEMQEIVDFIKQNKSELNSLGINNIAGLSLALSDLDTAVSNLNNTITTKVDKVTGKGLSTEDFTTAEKALLAGVEPGAERNVQADWRATEGDAYIKNKPIIPPRVDVDSELSEDSENPLENRVINNALATADGKINANSAQITNLQSTKLNQSDVVNALNSEATTRPLSAKQGAVLKQLIDNINTLLNSNDTTLDEMQEIVDFIKQNKDDLSNLGISNIAGLSLALDGKENSFSKRSAFNKNFGTSAGTVAQGNDSRINHGETAYGWGDHAAEGYLTSLPHHTHDDRYYTEAESDARFLGKTAKAVDSNLLDGLDSTAFLRTTGKAADSERLDGLDSSAFSRTTHNHDGRYYTEAESNARFLGVTAKAADSNQLEGYRAQELQSKQSRRDFTKGTLIVSDIDYSVTNGNPWLLEIEGNSYGSAVPFDIRYQGYIYNNRITSHGGISNGTNLEGLVVFEYNGNLCFWFPRQTYWQGFNVFINDSFEGIRKNRVVSITDVDKPTEITKEVELSSHIRQSWHSGNDGAGSGLDADKLDGKEASEFAQSAHNHDNRYYTESESDARFLGKTAKAADSNLLDGLDSSAFSRTTHNHDDRYYTETESDARFLGKTAKAADSNLLDGLDSTAFSRQTNIPTKVLQPGWYTIAVNRGDRASAKLVLRDTTSGRHQTVHFYAAHHFGNGNVINVLSNASYSVGGTISQLRIKSGGTYDGALLQAYIDSTNTNVMGIITENIQTSGWVAKNWVPDGTDPGNVNAFAKLTNITVSINLDKTQGIQSSEEIYVDGAQVYHKENKPTPSEIGALSASGKAVDSDKLDGLDSSVFSRTSHNHDTRYHTKGESNTLFLGKTAIAANSDKLDGLDSSAFSRSDHNHDDRYFTETESNNLFLGKTEMAADSDKLDGLHSSAFARTSHDHDDQYYTQTESDFFFLKKGEKAIDSDKLDGLHSSAFSRTSHGHQYITALDNRAIKPNTIGSKTEKQIRAYFTSLGGLTGAQNSDWQDLLVMDTYRDSSGGKLNALAFDKSENAIRHYQAAWNDTQWGSMKTLAYTEDLGDAYLGKTEKAADSDKLDGYNTATGVTANTVPVRDSAADITARLFRSNYQVQSSIAASGTVAMRVSTTDNYIRHINNAGFKAWLGKVNDSDLLDGLTSSAFLRSNAKAVDSDKLDGYDSSHFMRSNVNDSFSGQLTSTSRQGGIYGTYNNTLIDHIWSMGTNYKIAADGSNFGNLYGFAYKYINNPTGGTMAGSHQAVWCQNGVPNVALGAGIWTSGDIQTSRSIYMDGDLVATQSWASNNFLGSDSKATDSDKLDGLDSSAFLRSTAKAVDSDKLDGYDSSHFMRSNVNDSFSGTLVSTTRQSGIYGTYDNKLIDHIWSMGTGYKVASDGSNFGNLYGFAYKSTFNATGGTLANGHQAVWCQNGVPNVALGVDIWTSGDIKANGGYYYGDDKQIIRFNDNWLRFNPSNHFTSGIFCGSSILRTDRRIEIGSGGSAFYADSTGQGMFNNNLTVNGNIYGRSKNLQYSNLFRFGGLYLTWDSDSYGTQSNHSLRSTYGTTSGDSITLNSYNHIRFNLDSNNNNSDSKFEIGHNTNGTGNVIFSVNEEGNVATQGTVSAGTFIKTGGIKIIEDTDITLDPKSSGHMFINHTIPEPINFNIDRNSLKEFGEETEFFNSGDGIITFKFQDAQFFAGGANILTPQQASEQGVNLIDPYLASGKATIKKISEDTYLLSGDIKNIEPEDPRR